MRYSKNSMPSPDGGPSMTAGVYPVRRSFPVNPWSATIGIILGGKCGEFAGNRHVRMLDGFIA